MAHTPIGYRLVDIDGNPVSTLPVMLAADDPAVAVLGAITGAAVITDSNGTVQQYLRGLIKQWIAGTLVIGPGTALIGKVGLDQTTPGTTNKVSIGTDGSVTLLAGLAETGKVNWRHINVSGATLTRPANTPPYSVGDAISDNATAGSVTALTSNNLSDTNDDPINLISIVLSSTDTGPGTAGALIRLHLFNSDPTASSGVGAGDNAAWSNKQAGWFGSFSGTMTLFSDGSRGVLVPDQGPCNIAFPATGGKNIWWQLQTLTAFTPSANSTTFTPRFKGFQGRQ